MILFIQNGESYNFISQYFSLPESCRGSIRSIIISLQEKEIILKSYKVPNVGERFVPQDIPISKNFKKMYSKSSFELGKDLFEKYPIFGYINGEPVGIRSVSKKFDTLEDFYSFYGKQIRWDIDMHNKVIELVEWAKDHNILNCTLANFAVDHKWNELEALRNGEIANIDFNAIRQL